MSGFEVVGLTLGVLPLLISTIEHYDDILRPFTRYRNFTSKAQRFIDELETERTIFRTECQLLLAAVAGPKTAVNMLHDHHHPMWKDVAVQNNLSSQLGALGTACNALIAKIESKLREIGNKSELFEDVIAQAKAGNSSGDQSWRSRVRAKLIFSFSEPGLRQLIKDLRSLNKAFLTLSNQAARLDCYYDVSLQRNSNTNDIRDMVHEIKKFQMVQQASALMHGALSRACTIHSQHVVQLCLAARCSYPSDGSDTCKTRFSLAFSRTEPTSNAPSATDTLRSTEPATPCDWVWFEIESVIGKESGEDESPLSRHTEKKEDLTLKDTAESLRLQEPVATVLTKETMSSNTLRQGHGADSQLPNRQDLCMTLDTTISQEAAGVADSTVYTLEQMSGCKHFVHHPVSLNNSRSSISLAKLITRGPGGRSSGEMPQFQRLCHAKALALAVLQFHTTPWLSKSWNSDSIFFCGTSELALQPHQTDLIPHLNATVTPIDSPASSLNLISSASLAGVIPNQLLFDLGVMLLELAYNAPFQSLRQHDTLLASSEAIAGDFVAAISLADQVGISLGAGFAAIVKKCLRCDFGCGNSLEHPALQARLYEDVVCKLERLEEGFRRLQLND